MSYQKSLQPALPTPTIQPRQRKAWVRFEGVSSTTFLLPLLYPVENSSALVCMSLVERHFCCYGLIWPMRWLVKLTSCQGQQEEHSFGDGSADVGLMIPHSWLSGNPSVAQIRSHNCRQGKYGKHQTPPAPPPLTPLTPLTPLAPLISNSVFFNQVSFLATKPRKFHFVFG